MLLIPWDGWLNILFIGWSFAVFAMLVYMSYKVFLAPPPKDESDVVRRQRIRKVQEKIIKQNIKGNKKRSIEVGVNMASASPG